jgi:putative membrane protein
MVLFPLLLFLEASIVVTEKTPRKMLYAVLVILGSGFLGVVLTSSGFMPTDKALFPALSGLFGVSTLLLSSESGVEIPPQNLDIPLGIGGLRMLKSIVVGFLAGMTTGILPAVGSAQATILAQRLTRENDHRSFIVAVSGVNTGNMIFGLIALYTIGKARNGAVKAVEEILSGRLNLNTLLLLIGVVLLCGGIGAMLTRLVGRAFACNITRLPYVTLARGIVLMIAIMVALVSGPKGLLVLFASTFIGFLPPLLGIKRVHSMGFLMIPTLIYFSGYSSLILGLFSI